MVEAEPTSSIQYLMNEPVSMLDWGIYRITNRLEKNLQLGVVPFSQHASYDWDKNRIIIDIAVIGGTLNEEAKGWCRAVVSKIRTLMYINDKGNSMFNEGASSMYFSHYAGYAKKSEPEGLYKELDNITLIRVYVSTEGMKKPVSCEAPLLGTSIMYEE
jgi:hypothetical protein